MGNGKSRGNRDNGETSENGENGEKRNDVWLGMRCG